LNRLSSDFTERHEFIDDDAVQYVYSVLQPVDSDAGRLELFIAYLRKSEAVRFIFRQSVRLL